MRVLLGVLLAALLVGIGCDSPTGEPLQQVVDQMLGIANTGGGGTGDSYEPNNSSYLATTITPNAGAQSHTVYPTGDIDWFEFSATAGVTYIIETFGNADTYLQLYASNGISRLAFNDDGGFGHNAKITHTPSSSTTVYFTVSHYSNSATGSYTVSVTSDAGLTTWYAIRAEYRGYDSYNLIVKDSVAYMSSTPDLVLQKGATDLIEYSNESTCYDRFVVGYTEVGTDLVLEMTTSITNVDNVQNFGYSFEGPNIVFSNKFEYFTNTDWGDSTVFRTFVYRVVYQQSVSSFPPVGWPTSECTAVVSAPHAAPLPTGLVKRLAPRP